MSIITVNASEPPFAILPNQIHIDPNRYYKTTRDICYWTNESNVDEYLINEFIKKARQFNYSEEQALSVLTYNRYDFERSECDLHIYRPIKGLGKVDVKQLVKIISDGIGKTVKTREHRDFDDILLLFPGFTIGDVLGAYSKHRFLIKKQTYRVKKSIKKSISKPFVTNGTLKDSEPPWNESCLDTQFQLVYRKHFLLIQNYNNIQEMISRDLSEMKQSNRNGIKFEELNSYVDADGMLNLLRKMNRKRNKLGSAMDKAQLMVILNSTYSEKMSKGHEDMIIKEDANFINQSPCLSTPSTSPNADIASTSSKELPDENHFEEKLHEYVKDNLCQFVTPDESDLDDDKIDEFLQTILQKHESVLSGFKNILPHPNEFQQLSHSWDNMDFAILLLGLSEFGKDFKKISDAVFTKSESMIHSFYLNFGAEFSFDDIIPQPSSQIEAEILPKDDSLEMLSEGKVKIEESLDESNTVSLDVSNTSSENTDKCTKRKSANSSRSNRKRKRESSSSDQLFDEENPNLIVTRSYRSRTESKEIIDIKIEEEKKSYDKKSKKRLKRETSNSSEHQNKLSKQSRKE